jgi:hypothetical protein
MSRTPPILIVDRGTFFSSAFENGSADEYGGSGVLGVRGSSSSSHESSEEEVSLPDEVDPGETRSQEEGARGEEDDAALERRDGDGFAQS